MSRIDLGIIGYISHLPHSMPVALGVAMSFLYRDEPRVAMTFTGDGGSNTGLYHESLNMAGLYNAPLVVIVENNQYAVLDAVERGDEGGEHRRPRVRLRDARCDRGRQ